VTVCCLFLFFLIYERHLLMNAKHCCFNGVSFSFSGEAPPVQVLPKNLFHTRRPEEPHEDPLPGFCLLNYKRQARSLGKFIRNFLIKTFPNDGDFCFPEQLKKLRSREKFFSLKSDIYYSYLLQKRNNN